MKFRKNIQKEIFVILITKLGRNNKQQYCYTHAEYKAKLIENKLYDNCNKLYGKEWKEIYMNVNIEKLVDTVEEKTSICIYS